MTKIFPTNKFEKKEPLRGKHFVLFVFLGSFFIACLLSGVFAIKHAEAAFTIDVPYQMAVPDFLEAITEATESVKDEEELQDIAQWENEQRGRLPEFLQDLIEIAKQLEANGNEEFIFSEYQAFADKWNEISKSYPGLSELEPVLGPIIDQLLSGLPALGPTPSENPVGNLSELYVEMTQLNPWFVGLIWDVPLIDDTKLRSIVSEETRERTVNGYKSIDIIKRDIIVQLNGIVVFSELIENGTLTDRSVLLRGPSVLHETLEKMIEDGGAPREIAIVQEFINLINLNIEFALQNGIIDDCSYSFIFRRQLNGMKSKCTDINGNEQNFIEISKYSPFDHINQVELTHVDPLVKLTIPIGQKASTSLTNNLIEPAFIGTPSLSMVPSSLNAPVAPVVVPGPSANIPIVPIVPVIPPLEAWLLGILTPTYLWSAVGFLRLY